MSTHTSIPAVVLGLQGALNIAFGAYGVLQPVQMGANLAEQFGGALPRPALYASR